MYILDYGNELKGEMPCKRMGLVLYVGGDDSNHGNKKKRGEVIVATFSILPEDSQIEKLGNKRDFGFAFNYVSSSGRDWNFTIRGGDQYFGKSQNIPLVLPTLIQCYLHNHPNHDIREVSTFIDGELKNDSKSRFLEDVANVKWHTSLEVSIMGFTKKRVARAGGFSKSYHCPRLVWVANSIANYLGGQKTYDVFEHPKMITPLVDF